MIFYFLRLELLESKLNEIIDKRVKEANEVKLYYHLKLSFEYFKLTIFNLVEIFPKLDYGSNVKN